MKSNFNPNFIITNVLGETNSNPEKVERIILTAGKHYYSLLEKKQTLKAQETVLIRLESFCPFPLLHLRQELEKYPRAKSNKKFNLVFS